MLRGELVEQFVLDALGDGWMAASDWEAWDVQSVDGKHRIQVKQSAARQIWADVDCKPSNARFSIKGSMAWTDAGGWSGEISRQATLYVFAWHPLVDALADHRDPEQWEFYLISSDKLPEQKSIGLNAIKTLCARSMVGGLSQRLAALIASNS